MKNKKIKIIMIVSIIIIILTYFIPIRREREKKLIEKDNFSYIGNGISVGTSYTETRYVEDYYNIYNIKIFSIINNF